MYGFDRRWIAYKVKLTRRRLIVQANMSAAEQDRLPEEELLGQMSYASISPTSGIHQNSNALSFRTFILAAMDTTSNALAMTLYLLAEHSEVQDKLRQEILQASKGEDIGYDTLVSLPYLDAVCRETLRLYVSVVSL